MDGPIVHVRSRYRQSTDFVALRRGSSKRPVVSTTQTRVSDVV